MPRKLNTRSAHEFPFWAGRRGSLRASSFREYTLTAYRAPELNSPSWSLETLAAEFYEEATDAENPWLAQRRHHRRHFHGAGTAGNAAT